MAKWTMWLFVAVFFILYSLINFYIGLRGWQYLFRFIPFIDAKVYWLIFWLLAWLVFIERLCQRYIPFSVDILLTRISSYWLGMMFYLFIIFGLVDLVLFLGRIIQIIPKEWIYKQGSFPLFGIAVFMLVLFLQVYGTWNALNPQVQRYHLSIPKEAGNLEKIRVAMVSDIHLDKIVNSKRLEEMVSMVNQINPDIVLFAGDVIDGSVDIFSREKIDEIFQRITPSMGVYAVLGNHEYISGQIDEYIQQMERAGVRVLRDEWVLIQDSFYLIGKDDFSRKRFTGTDRGKLEDIIRDVDTSLPIILLDHEPPKPGEEENEIDLQFSGHTHRGQLFPIHLITRHLFENDWGYSQLKNRHLIVSSGFGTWGPPIRIGNRPEIVDVTISFLPKLKRDI
ncbi:MAG: metallophosphoesterase [Desulfitobacteriaceae bacterium]|nr:metallophosphoesterase [Desulfitobacteriaceae bacterium]